MIIIKLNEELFNYLEQNFIRKYQYKIQNVDIQEKEGYHYFTLNEDLSDEINDWANDQLLLKGFSPAGDLTKEGEILEQIIDLFFVD